MLQGEGMATEDRFQWAMHHDTLWAGLIDCTWPSDVSAMVTSVPGCSIVLGVHEDVFLPSS